MASSERRVVRAPGPGGWMLICLLLPTLIYICAVQEPEPRWRATYFDNASLEGEGRLNEERDVDHDWRGARPGDGTPDDAFSARWDSCLSLEDEQSVAFQLSSAGGARLLIDDAPVIDDWGSHPLRTKGTELTLPAGVHHLRVEFSSTVESPSVTLVASFDEERPRRIAPERLRVLDGDSQQPCKSAPRTR
ncbi:MAG: PA14 domain-containing protein [Polyangiales bacterium]